MRTSCVAILALVTALCAPSGRVRADPAATDFGAEARLMFRVAACGGDDPVPPRFSARSITAHCKQMHAIYTSYRRAWAERAAAFIAGLRPGDLPGAVVYPFGGGDLSSALVVYPDATELTTISLEAAGDIRVIDTIKSARLDADIAAIRNDINRLYRSAHSTTKSLQAASHSELPGTIMFALAGLAVHGMEPIALRYFDIEPDGSLRYLTSAELTERAAELAARKREKPGADRPRKVTHYWYEQTSAFANVEIRYRLRNKVQSAPRIYRHIVANLDDSHMTKDDRVLRHLREKGKVAVMTKAASFLLWYDDFSQIRDYLLGHMAWMISDASGIPPSHAGPAGFEQITYGEFTGPYFIQDPKNTRAEMVKLWKSQPVRELPFRFGYPNADKHNHLMITRPRSGAAPAK